MPRKWGPCSEPGCPTLTEQTHCEVHARKPWASSTRRARLPSNWNRLVAFVMARDGRHCYLCGGPAVAVDHIVNNDNHDPVNLAAICKSCHDEKTARESAAGRRRWTDG